MKGINRKHYFGLLGAVVLLMCGIFCGLFFATKATCYAGRRSATWKDEVLAPTMLYASIAAVGFTLLFYLPWLRLASCVPHYVIFGTLVMILFYQAGVLVLVSSFMCGADEYHTDGRMRLLWKVQPQYFVMGALWFCATVHFFFLTLGRLRSWAYNILISYPFSIYCSSTLVLLFFTPAIAAIPSTCYNYVPWVVAMCCALLGLYHSLRTPSSVAEYEVVEIDVTQLGALSQSLVTDRVVSHDLPIHRYGEHPCSALTASQGIGTAAHGYASVDSSGKHGAAASVSRLHLEGSITNSAKLRIAQITDPHMGAIMTPTRLRTICQQVAELAPDLILVTGDMLTVESHREPTALSHALEPLIPLAKENRVFACLGNHDIEDDFVESMVRRAFEQSHIRLLVDETCLVATRLGVVEVIGMQFYFRHRRKAGIEEFFKNSYRNANFTTDLTKSGRQEGTHSPEAGTSASPVGIVQTVIMLHDPAAFQYIPRGIGHALVFSGHTHGGHMGFYCIGLRHWTFGRLFRLLDNGVWICNGNILYVHRGQGSRSLLSNAVLRMGVPCEYSLQLVLPVQPRKSGEATLS